jgi:hypothetical protein
VNLIHCNLESENLSEDSLVGEVDIIYLELSSTNKSRISGEIPEVLVELSRWEGWNGNPARSGELVRNLVLARDLLREGGTLYLRCRGSEACILRGIAEVLFESEGVNCGDEELFFYENRRRGRADGPVDAPAKQESSAAPVPVQLTNCVSYSSAI